MNGLVSSEFRVLRLISLIRKTATEFCHPISPIDLPTASPQTEHPLW